MRSRRRYSLQDDGGGGGGGDRGSNLVVGNNVFNFRLST